MNQLGINSLSIVAFLGYAFIVYRMVYFAVYSSAQNTFLTYLKNRADTTVIYLTIIGHCCYILNEMWHNDGVDMRLLIIMNLTFWFMFAVVRVCALRYFSPLMLFIIALFNGLNLLIDISLLEEKTVLVDSYSIVIHAILSLLAYSLCGLVIIQACIFSFQEKGLRIHRSWRWLDFVPALEKNENLFYALVYLSFCSLSLSILSGFLVLDDWLAQHVAHKTVFTMLAWLIMGILLLLKKRYIVMPEQSSRWALVACMLLIVGVFGSKVILEFILIR